MDLAEAQGTTPTDQGTAPPPLVGRHGHREDISFRPHLILDVAKVLRKWSHSEPRSLRILASNSRAPRTLFPTIRRAETNWRQRL